MSEDITFVDPEEGFELLRRPVTVTADEQAEKHEVCGLDTAVFQGNIDVSFFIRLGIHAGIVSGISAEGNINMVQSLIQHRPVPLGEPLTVRGTITKVEAVPRGQAVETDVWFEDADGERAVSAWRRSLRPTPGAAGRGAGARPAPVVTDVDALDVDATHTLTPECVKAFSSEGNSIHYDMDAAVRAGFRAPMIGGGMGVHYLMTSLWARKAPASFDLDIFFRRPIFWDDTFAVAFTPSMDATCLWRDEAGTKKVLTEAAIREIAFS